ncbi:MAG: hypothetical protein ACI9BJ_001150, partial [Flavobacteriales bacterium]
TPIAQKDSENEQEEIVSVKDLIYIALGPLRL